MKIALVIMTGIGFTLGVVFGLLLQLPSDGTLPADPNHPGYVQGAGGLDPDTFRSRRSLSDHIDASIKISVSQSGPELDNLPRSRASRHHHLHHSQQKNVGNSQSMPTGNNDIGGYPTNSRRQNRVKQQLGDQIRITSDESTVSATAGSLKGKRDPLASTKQRTDGPANTGDNPISGSMRDGQSPNNERIDLPREGLQRSMQAGQDKSEVSQQMVGNDPVAGYPQQGGYQNSQESGQNLAYRPGMPSALNGDHRGPNYRSDLRTDQQLNEVGSMGESPVRLTIDINTKESKDRASGVNGDINKAAKSSSVYTSEEEDVAFLQSLVKGVAWTQNLESSCPRSFHSTDVEAWRKKAAAQDVVKMEQGCGRMQNRLLTFRDSSKACARYRLNTDQIQGEIFSYYLSKLLNISNIPPTILVQVNSVLPKWRTVHLDMSLAHWADNKLVVLTQFIPNLSSAYIPVEFRGEGHDLEPTLETLGSKTPNELCELVQWSDLVILDYLTANLDRVINNMFNKQWNDQMMSNPAHNLEKFDNGALVFLDNESGLFHGYRLLDKYSTFHQSLLHSVCVFRESTVEAVKKLHKSRNIGQELLSLFSQNEEMHQQLAGIPEKNLKVLQQRLDDVHEQILKCEQSFGR